MTYTELVTVHLCSVDGCDDAKYRSHDFCRKHHERWMRHGDPLITLVDPPGEPLDFPPHVVSLSEVETAWVAGLLEGEGCFYLTYRKNTDGTPRPLVSVICTMTDEDVIQRLRSTIGTGGVTTRMPKNPKWSQSWTWTDSNMERVIPLIKHLHPHMGQRRQGKIDEMLAAAANWERQAVRDHGTLARYRRGCRCVVCRGANAKQHREYMAGRREQGAA